MKFDIKFINQISKLAFTVIKHNVKIIDFRLEINSIKETNQLVLSYLFSLFHESHLLKKIIYIDENVKHIFEQQIKPIRELNKAPLIKKLKGSQINYGMLDQYKYKNEFDNVINGIVETILKHNITINAKPLRNILTTTIGEIFDNASTHSEEDRFYFYNYLNIQDNNFYSNNLVIDYGKTIINKVSEYNLKNGLPKISNLDCLLWALQKSNTTKELSGGLGLPTLLDSVEKFEGSVHILTGNTYYTKTGIKDINYKEIDYFFPGTAIMFSFKLFNNKIYDFDSQEKVIKKISLSDLLKERSLVYDSKN